MDDYLSDNKHLKGWKFPSFNGYKWSQSMVLADGMPVISHRNAKGFDVYNNEEFLIQSINENCVTLRNDDREDPIVKIPKSIFQGFFTVAFSTTIHKSQGQTFTKPYVIWGIKGIHFFGSNRLLRKLQYVAVTRTTKKELIYLPG